MPSWRVITVDGVHPRGGSTAADNIGLVATRCGPPNIDPAKLTTLAMTGTSALTRFVAVLMDTTYPTRDVEPWRLASSYLAAKYPVDGSQITIHAEP